jgi:hypothetical protein
MGQFDNYRTRLGWSGTSDENAFSNSTTHMINAQFDRSPSYMNVAFNGVNTDIRLLRDSKTPDNPHIKRTMFKPGTIIQEGSIGVINGDNWLVFESSKHPIYPTAQILQCNENMKWQDLNGTIYQYPCVITENKKEFFLKDDKFMEMTTFQTKVYTPYNTDLSSVKAGLRVLFGNSAYLILGCDSSSHVFDGYGLLIFSVDLTRINPSDDFVNKIADNSSYYLPETHESDAGVGDWNWAKR